MAQATASARNGEMPVAIIDHHGGAHADDLAVLRLVDLAVRVALDRVKGGKRWQKRGKNAEQKEIP